MLSFPSPAWSRVAEGALKPSFLPPRVAIASLILPRLYLSNYFTACDTATLQRLGITHVISVMESAPAVPELVGGVGIQRMQVKIADRHDVDILAHLGRTTAFIRTALEENESNAVLVHCFQGVSRSATVVCAYLVATKGMTGIESITFVQGKRGIVRPNDGFRRQLNSYSVQFVGGRAEEGTRKTRSGASIAGRIRQIRSRGPSDVMPEESGLFEG